MCVRNIVWTKISFVLFLQRLITINMRHPWMFFFLLKPEFSWTSINTLFCSFLMCSDSKGSFVAEWGRLTRTIWMTTAFLILFISLRWRITLLKQWGLFELREIAEILSIVNLKVFRLFIYLFWKKAREPQTNCQGA